MYAKRFDTTRRFNPGGLSAALAVNGVLVTALLFSAPTIVDRIIDTPLQSYNVPLPPEPVPEPPRPEPRVAEAAPAPPVVTPRPRVDRARPDAPPIGTTTLPPLPPSGPTAGTGVDVVPPVPPVRVPVRTGAAVDPRYRDDFQPAYPPSERRAEQEGVVTVRVRIAASGRVVAVERVSATNDAFFEATRRQALARWRFTPATEDGAAVEAWRQMTVRFELRD